MHHTQVDMGNWSDALHTHESNDRVHCRRLYGLPMILLGLLTLGACASAPPPETRPFTGAGRTMDFLANIHLVDGNSVWKAGYCSAIKDVLNKRICGTILDGRKFSSKALQICQSKRSIYDHEINRCLESIANVVFSEPSLQICEQMPDADRNRKCLDAVANRRLGNSQVKYCSLKDSANKTIRCLARATNYVFDPEVLQRIVTNSLHASPPPILSSPDSEKELRQWWQLTPTEQREALLVEARFKARQQGQLSRLFTEIRGNIAKSFPQLQVEQDKYNFLFNFAGGANGQMQLLYCSDKEYLLIFGAPISVDAYSGRYRVLHIFDWVLSGKMSVFHEGDFVSHDIYPGQETFLPRDNTKTYATEPMTYVLEYGRGGTTASGLEFGVRAPARALTRDFRNQRQQIQACGRLAAREEIQIVARKLRARKLEVQRRREIRRDIREVRRKYR